jgi:hypothetical protein
MIRVVLDSEFFVECGENLFEVFNYMRADFDFISADLDDSSSLISYSLDSYFNDYLRAST